MKVAVVALAVAFTLSGCVLAPPKQNVTLGTTFNPQEVAWFNTTGTGSISGQALMRTRGGEARTCAGLQVMVEPRSAYADERMVAIYSSTERGFRPILGRQVQFSSNDPAYRSTHKVTTCDAQGNFSFTGLPAGQYYVVAPVVWEVGYSRQGGTLMQHVVLKSGESQHIVLTP